jgi:dienelactone hydrolase
MTAPKTTAGPPTASYDDVVAEVVRLRGRDGIELDALRFRPSGDGPFPAVAVGAEATGINQFIRRVGATLALAGDVVIVPDYFRGQGPPGPEDYEDFDTLVGYIDALDFQRATSDLLAAVDHARKLPYVDADDVAVWGYCTGATLALFAAELDRGLSAARCSSTRANRPSRCLATGRPCTRWICYGRLTAGCSCSTARPTWSCRRRCSQNCAAGSRCGASITRRALPERWARVLRGAALAVRP